MKRMRLDQSFPRKWQLTLRRDSDHTWPPQVPLHLRDDVPALLLRGPLRLGHHRLHPHLPDAERGAQAKIKVYLVLHQSSQIKGLELFTPTFLIIYDLFPQLHI